MCLLGFILIIIVANLEHGTVEALVFSGTGQVEVPGPNISFIEQPPFQVNVFDGKDYFLTCRLNLSFPGNVTQTVWFRGEHKVRAERDGTLKLSGNRNSAGVYRCLVNQTYLSTSSHVVYPVFQRDPLLDKSRTPVEGTSIILDCPFTSIPKANITWTFGDSGKISDNRFLKFSNGSLLIKNIKQSNSGRYTCKAENLYARKNKTHRQLTYEVTVKPTTNNSINNKHLLPRLQADVQYIPLGGTLRLQCDSQSSDGDVKIMWTLWRTENGRKVITPNNFVLENSNRSLIVGNLTNAHYGNYTCQNEYGEQTFQVLRQQKPIIKTPLKSIACILNAPINLTCEATGAPKPKITWFRNGQLLSNNYTMEINESSLLIQSFDINDEGIYQCFAQNSAGETQSLGELRLTENMKQKLDTLPKPLMNLKCSPIDIGAVNISFEAPSLPDDIGMAITNPWDSILITSSKIKRLKDNRHYFIYNDMKESRKFTVFTTLLRVYTNTFEVFHEKGRNSEVMSSFFSEPLHCTTQGLPISLWKDRFMIHWNPDKIPNIESFVVQMLLPFSRGKSFQGITNSSEDVQEIFEKKDEELFKNLASKNILSLVFPPNVRGIAFPEMKKLNVRLLAITDENKKLMTTENLEQLSWTLVRRKYLYVVSVEPKSVVFRSMKDLEMNFYLKICHKKVMADEIHCETNLIKNGEPLVYDNLATKTLHKFIFYNSSTDQELDEIQIKTGVERPGAVDCRIEEKDDGILMTWAKQKDVDVLGYKVLWTVNNEQHERIFSKDTDSFTIPNISKNQNFQITIYANGTSGFSDPTHLDNESLGKFPFVDKEKPTSKLPVWGAVILGVLLSIICVVICISIACCMRNYYKTSSIQQSETQSSLTGKGPKNEYQERQILIPTQTTIISTANGLKPRKSSTPLPTRNQDSKERMWDYYTEEQPQLPPPPINGYHFEMKMANSVIVPPNRQHLNEPSSTKPADIPINNNNNTTSPILHIHSNGHAHHQPSNEQDSTMTTDISDLTMTSTSWTPNHRSFVESTC